MSSSTRNFRKGRGLTPKPQDDGKLYLERLSQASQLLKEQNFSSAAAVAEALMDEYPDVISGYLCAHIVYKQRGQQLAQLTVVAKMLALFPDEAFGYVKLRDFLGDAAPIALVRRAEELVKRTMAGT